MSKSESVPVRKHLTTALAERTLAGQVAVVTGAAGGLGSALVRALAVRGVVVVGCDLNVEGVEHVAAESDGSVHGHRLDLTDPSDIERSVGAVTSRHGEIDILIHAAVRHFPAAVGQEARPFIDHSPAQVLETLAVAVTGPTLLTQLVSQRMVARGTGRIVFTGSMHRTGSPGLVMYAAAKAYVNTLARGLFLELREHDIITSVANPGGMNTGLHWHRYDWMLDPAVVAETIVQQIALPGNVALLSFDMVPHDPEHPDGF
jgi:NAD(P)-dependent dehydrogenase (short-subunit alcohol dehydrogenase family)